jgi:hypothetical protein
MANGRNRTAKKKGASVDGGFAGVPRRLMELPVYQRLSHPARALLLELAYQYRGGNNGKLLAGSANLAPRGWTSNDVIYRALRALLEAGLIHQTVQGHRPHKASWFAVTWNNLDQLPGYDPGAAETFRRLNLLPVAGLIPAGGAMGKATAAPGNGVEKNAMLTPSGGVGEREIAPSGGVEGSLATPSGGAIKGVFSHSSTPSNGDPICIAIPV